MDCIVAWQGQVLANLPTTPGGVYLYQRVAMSPEPLTRRRILGGSP